LIYLTNGNMPLNAAYADEIVQEDNSTYQLSFRFPTSDPLWEKLKEETFLTADDLHGEQDFVIFEIEKKHGYIQVYANQVFTLLNNYVVSSLTLDRATGSTALSRFAGAITRDNPFSFFSDIEDRHTFNIGSKNAMEAFAKDKHSIIGQWGGDLVRHGYQVRLLKNGGSENESLFMYKKNLSSYQHKTSTKSLKTRITFIATVKGEGEKAPDRTFTVTIDSPLINKYSQIYEDVIEVSDQDVKDEASLRKYGEQYYRTSLCDMMEDSLEIEVVGQSDVPVQMFDVVSIFHERYNLDVRKKITKYTYSPMAKKLKSIGFGQFQSGLANAIGNAVSDAVNGEVQQLQGNFERQLARELKNADLAFDRKTEELKNEFEDGLNATRAKAEEVVAALPKDKVPEGVTVKVKEVKAGTTPTTAEVTETGKPKPATVVVEYTDDKGNVIGTKEVEVPVTYTVDGKDYTTTIPVTVNVKGSDVKPVYVVEGDQPKADDVNKAITPDTDGTKTPVTDEDINKAIPTTEGKVGANDVKVTAKVTYKDGGEEVVTVPVTVLPKVSPKGVVVPKDTDKGTLEKAVADKVKEISKIIINRAIFCVASSSR